MLLLAACLFACSACTGPTAILPADPGLTLPGRVFQPGPSEDRFITDRGQPVSRIRSAPDASGRWTTQTEGPDEQTRLTLSRRPDGTVVLHSLESGGRRIECDPPLEIEPPPGHPGIVHETACRLDGDPGRASAVMGTDPDLGHGWVALGLEFTVSTLTVRRRFGWRFDTTTDRDHDSIAEERVTLRVTVLGVPVRTWSRSMTRQP